VKDSPEFSVVANELIEWISNRSKSNVLIAAHNASFDKRIFEQELKKSQISIPKWEWKDTIPIFSRIFKSDNITSCALDELCKKYLNKPQTSHRAKEDLDNLTMLMDLAAKRIGTSKTTSYIWNYFFSLMK
jgi:DNA polymerase III alpha subunit (gram-positive type)